MRKKFETPEIEVIDYTTEEIMGGVIVLPEVGGSMVEG